MTHVPSRQAAGWAVALALAGTASAGEANWPQFRGPGGQGVAEGKAKLPTKFGPTTKVLWKTALPAGWSSPCVWGKRIFLTGYDAKTKKLETLCLDRAKGGVLWRQAAPADKLEKIHVTNSPAAATPATDGDRVYVYFGSYGLLCYDLDGKELWKLPLPTPATRFGSGTSPVVAGGVVLLKCQGGKPTLLALDAKTGKPAWKKEKLPFDPAYSVPLVREHKGGREVVVHGETGVRAYDLKDGAERWALGGMFCAAIPSPVEAGGMLYLVAQFPGGDQDDEMKLPAFADLLKKYDKDKDGALSKEEVKDVVLYSRDGKTKEGDITLGQFFAFIDGNKDGKISKAEWTLVLTFMPKPRNALMAVRPDPAGKAAKPEAVWEEKNALPEVSSPLVYQGRLYLVKHGGLVTCLDAKSGKLLYRKRVPADGLYYSSPVAGDGKVYVASLRGTVTVLDGGGAFKVLARNDLGEQVGATPAAVDGVLYVRTEKHLYAFKE